MSAIHTSTVQSVHAYTRADVPWELGENRQAHGETTKGRRFGWRLFHYISSGGMRTFGRTVRQEEAARNARRLLAGMAVFWAVWALFYFL